MLDILGAFRSENEPSEAGGAVSSLVPQSITVASILARSVPLEWYEAVAISQSVSEQLQASGDASATVRLVPEHVAIDAAGDVHVAAVRKSGGESALNQVAELLRLMLSTAAVPAPLRLALSQTSVASSLKDWSESIAYYERPGRQALIQAVYERAMVAPQTAPGVAQQPAPVAPPMPPSVAPGAEQRNRKPSAIARFVPALVLAVIVTAIAAAGVWLWQSLSSVSGARVAEGPPTLESRFDAAADAMGSLVGRIPAFRESASLEVEPPPPPLAGRWIHLPSGRLTAIERSPMGSPPIAWSSPLPVGAVSPAIVISPRPAIGSSVPPLTYSAADAGVIPPVAVYPQFPKNFPPGTTDDNIAEFDVIVTETGNVESVKARRVPPTMGEAVRMTMSLSAAKSWRFLPGLKDGEPVRYRQVIRVLNH